MQGCFFVEKIKNCGEFMKINLIGSVKNLSKKELCLWIFSMLAVTATVFLGSSLFEIIAGIIGVSSLIFAAKGDVLGQILIVIFAVMYGIISLSFSYYGEMITYLGMTAPIAVLAVISWIRHPFEGNNNEVEVNTSIKLPEVILTAISAIIVTIIFYFILKAFGNNSLMLSTVSVTTSFLASYLTFRRCRYYAICYAANDLVLVGLWVIASLENPSYISMVVCFAVFFVNDLYGFYNWGKISKSQQTERCE